MSWSLSSNGTKSSAKGSVVQSWLLGSRSGRSWFGGSSGMLNWYRPFVAERREPFHVFVGYRHSVFSKFVQGFVHVFGVPQHDCVDDESEGAELVFLAFSVALAELPAVSVEEVSCEGVAAFGAVELGQDSPPVTVVVEVCEQVQRFRYPAEFRDRTAKRCRPATALQNAKELGGFHRAGGEAPGDTEQVIPVRDDQVGVDLIPGYPVEYSVVGGSFCAPEAGRADVGKTGAELVAEETE